MPTTSDEALRLALKLAVEAGEYERAAALLDMLRRSAAAGLAGTSRSTRPSFCVKLRT